MTAAFSAAWQTFRLGLHILPTSRAAFSTLRPATGALKLQLASIGSRYGLLQGGSYYLESWYSPNIKRPTSSTLHELNKHIRCVSFWRPPPEDVPRAKTAENEISISPEDIEKVFGRKIDPGKGIEILLTLQKHRSNGTLDHNIPFPNALVSKGLAYLRTVNPIDEDAAIIARIDRETDRIPQTNIERSPHAVSQFDKLRQEQKERNKTEDAKREAEEKEKLEQGPQATSKEVGVRGNKTTTPSSDLVGLRPEPEWVRNYREKATSHDREKIVMPVWARLLPSAAVTITVVVLSVLFAQNYTPPSRKARLWPDIPPAAATVIALIGLNCLVFVLWRVPPLWKFMSRNFLVAPIYPYAMSMIGAAFSHHQTSHLFANIAALWLIGTRVHDDIGRGAFLALYFSSAAIAAYIPMAIYVLRNIMIVTTLGASGALCGLLATFFVLHEGTNIEIWFLPPEWTQGIDTGILLVIFVLSEIWGIRKHGIIPRSIKLPGAEKPRNDNMGHLTGYFTGIGAGALIRSTDPKWRDLERNHFLTKEFGKTPMQPASAKPPAE